jgi:hypothetical protein
MFTQPTNADRAYWAQVAVDAFREACPTDECDAIQDLICDLMHLARAKGDKEPQAILNGATMHFEAEEQEEAEASEETT